MLHHYAKLQNQPSLGKHPKQTVCNIKIEVVVMKQANI